MPYCDFDTQWPWAPRCELLTQPASALAGLDACSPPNADQRRSERLSQRARLTVAALARRGQTALLSLYLERFPLPLASVSAEVVRFVGEHANDEFVGCLARFERAIVDAAAQRQALPPKSPSFTFSRDSVMRVHPWRVIVFPARAEDLIVSAVLGTGLPLRDRTPVVVGPGVPTLWREATRCEDVLRSWLVRPRSVRESARVFPRAADALRGLVQAGVTLTSLAGS